MPEFKPGDRVRVEAFEATVSHHVALCGRIVLEDGPEPGRTIIRTEHLTKIEPLRRDDLVETVEQLDALPVGSIVCSHGGSPYGTAARKRAAPLGGWVMATSFSGPIRPRDIAAWPEPTVVHVPAAA